MLPDTRSDPAAEGPGRVTGSLGTSRRDSILRWRRTPSGRPNVKRRTDSASWDHSAVALRRGNPPRRGGNDAALSLDFDQANEQRGDQKKFFHSAIRRRNIRRLSGPDGITTTCCHRPQSSDCSTLIDFAPKISGGLMFELGAIGMGGVRKSKTK
jgi:hypothetical protein